MLEFVQFTALGISIVSFCLSITAVLIQYAKRHEHPVIAPIEAEISTLRLGMIEVIDKLEVFTRRDRTRRARADAQAPDDTLPEPSLLNPPTKATLREIARAKGMLR